MSAVRGVVAICYSRLRELRSTNYLRYWTLGLPDAEMGNDFTFWVVETDDGLIVVDTGFSAAAAARRGMPVDVDPVEAFAQAGYAVRDVRDVILTHLHFDHAGNVAAFPGARVWVQESEYAFWTGPMAARPQFAQLHEPDDLAALADARADGRLRLVDGVAEVTDRVQLLPAPGHTVGSQAVVIDADGHGIVLAGDAVHFADELEHDLAYTIVADLPALYRTYDVLRDLAATGAAVVPGHDTTTAERYASRPLPHGGTVVDLLRPVR